MCNSLFASVVAPTSALLMHWEAMRFSTREWNHKNIAVEVVMEGRENKSQMFAKVVK